MKIFVNAFVDTNFGDNLFLRIVMSRYPKYDFYMVANDGYERSYQLLKKYGKNLYLIDKEKVDSIFDEMDAMLIIGGDLFGDYGDYSLFLKRMYKIKARNGWVAIMGISLFENYSEKTKSDFRQMFTLADIVVVREKQTYIQVKKLVPEANVIASTDMAFTFKKKNIKKIPAKKGLLGISVRRKIPRNTPDKYEQYCEGLAETVTFYLDGAKENEVVFLAFSTGVFDDVVVAKEILKRCNEEYRNRIRIIAFDGNVESYIQEIQKCEKMLCTRFHALVFAIILEKPFVPIVYEEKMKRLLAEIAYYGFAPAYEEKIEPQQILESFEKGYYSDQELEYYLKKANLFFKQTDYRLKCLTYSNRKGNIKKVLRKYLEKWLI